MILSLALALRGRWPALWPVIRLWVMGRIAARTLRGRAGRFRCRDFEVEVIVADAGPPLGRPTP